ncbi:MAG: fumarylacetoacetate hydrolase family protein [Chloroflexi bacterium]|nr:fumarylacetoacetate hydrolase family protein [Chloroflexota bacterium]
MRLITFSHRGQVRLGAMLVRDGSVRVLDLSQAQPGLPADMVEFLNAGAAALAQAEAAIRAAGERDLLPMADVTLLAPVPRPGKIICLGYNYADHLGIGRTEPPAYPIFFCKTVNTVVGPGQAIVIPPITNQVDYEAELAVVIGRRARHVAEARTYDFVAGYTIFNDVSARDFQKRSSQWMLGKSFDTFGPMGPVLVTSDEIPDPHCLELSLTLNGLELQRTNTANMIFPIPFLIAYLSAVLTLEPGDVISTGTPAKTALAHTLPPFMQPGDTVRIAIEKIGELVNPVVAEG